MQNKVKIIDGNSKNCKWDEDYEQIDYLSEKQWLSQQKEAELGQEKSVGQEVSHQVPQLKREEEQQHDVNDDKPEEDERAHLKEGIYR